jgi:UDP-N-acetylmuramate dehydrogenase
MTQPPSRVSQLIDRLADIDGVELVADAPLVRATTLRIGGHAELLASVSTESALIEVVARLVGSQVPLHLLGLGSNLLVPDEGLAGLVVRLVDDFKDYQVTGERVTVGAAMPLALLANRLTKQGLLGLEALSGFPSSVGGAVFMNAGCYGTEIKDVLISTRVLRLDGRVEELRVADLEPGYRCTNLHGTGAMVMSARFQLERGDGEAALAHIKELNAKRWASLPSGKPTAGSIFRNPEGDYAGRLIEACGLKGHRIGGAALSEKHANVIVNLGEAKAEDVFGLMAEAYRRVKGQFGIELHPEVVLAGSLSERWWREVVVRSESA